MFIKIDLALIIALCFLKLNIPFGVSDGTKVKIKEKKDIILENKLKKKEAKKKAKEERKNN